MQQPLGVAVEHGVVALEGLLVFGQAGGEQARFDRHGVEDWRREVDDFGSGGRGFLAEEFDAFAILGEAFLAKRIIHSAVHPVARDDQIGLGLGEHPVEAFVDGGPRELAARVTRLAQAADGFAGQTEVDELRGAFGMVHARGGFEDVHVAAGVSDAVAEEDDALHAVQAGLGSGIGGKGE